MLNLRIEYVPTTTHTNGVNVPIETGCWLPVNLTAPPLGFPEPILEVQDGPASSHRLALWRISDLREVLVGSPL